MNNDLELSKVSKNDMLKVSKQLHKKQPLVQKQKQNNYEKKNYPQYKNAKYVIK